MAFYDDPQRNLTDNDRPRCTSALVEGVHLLSVSGEVDCAVHSDLKRALETAVANAHSSLVIDLTGVHYIDSSGFMALIGAWKQMTERHDSLYLVSNPNVRRLLRTLGLDQVFDFYDTQCDAVATALQNEMARSRTRALGGPARQCYALGVVVNPAKVGVRYQDNVR
jgi:anti-anti-sigma factor